VSLLRVRHPDQPPRDVDLGPSTGRIHMSRLGIRGGGPYIVGAMAVGESSKTIADRGKREYKAREAEKARARRTRCGKILRRRSAPSFGEPCARTLGHHHDCKSAAALALAAEVKRTNRPYGGFRL
jgi:hypothetical protein